MEISERRIIHTRTQASPLFRGSNGYSGYSSINVADHLNGNGGSPRKTLLAGASLASSFWNVTGFSLIIGLSGGLDTLSGQVYGAKLYRKLGVQTYTSMFCLALVCVSLSLIWFNIGKLLVLFGQDPSIAYKAGNYASWLIPGLFSYAFLQLLTRYFQNQSLLRPLLITACFVFCLHIPLSWLLVYKSGLGYIGGALALSLSYWLYAILLGSFMCFSSACFATCAPLSMEIFNGVGEFFR